MLREAKEVDSQTSHAHAAQYASMLLRPTRADFVLPCMKKHGGQTMDNLYACACEIDAIALMMPYDTFIEASTFESYRNMPGEKGGVFRDSTQGEKLVTQLHKAQEEAEHRCFIRARTAKPR